MAGRACAEKTHKTDFYLTFTILAGAKTPTGQTASEKRGVPSKLDFKFSAHSDKY
jgi:hypothetical protein